MAGYVGVAELVAEQRLRLVLQRLLCCSVWSSLLLWLLLKQFASIEGFAGRGSPHNAARGHVVSVMFDHSMRNPS